MEHGSMVHALDEIRRTLKPNGLLIDLRPVEDHWSVEAAFKAMREVESRRWFIKEKEEEFAFFYYWDTPSEMKEFMEDEWQDFEKLEEAVFQKTKSLWASANADARVRVHVKMLITRWK